MALGLFSVHCQFQEFRTDVQSLRIPFCFYSSAGLTGGFKYIGDEFTAHNSDAIDFPSHITAVHLIRKMDSLTRESPCVISYLVLYFEHLMIRT